MTSAHQCFTYNPDLSLAENVICCGEDEVVQSRTHWSINVHETLLSSGKDGLLHVTILGGSDFSSFCWISDVDVERVNVHNGYLVVDDIILEVQGEKVAGYTQQDLLDFIWSVSRNHCPILLKTVSSAYLTKSLRQFLTTCLPKDSVDQNLQQVIRKNLYRKALPCTTRSPRQGEFDGVNYKFLTVEEFLALENSGSLLESGLYNGNYYGTPKPSLSIYSTAKANVGHMKASKEPGNISSDENVKKLLSRTDLSGSDSLKTRENNREGGGEGENEDEKGKDIEAENLSESSVATASSCNLLAQQHTLSFDDFAIAINSQCLSSDHSQSRDLDLENSGFSASSLTANDFELTGDFIKTQLTKSAHGLGFTIVSAGDSSVELLQIKSILPGGPADTDGQLHTGDVLVYVDSQSVFGFSHSDIINLFQSIPVGSKVNLEVCRGYSFYFDPDDPSTEVVTTVAVTHPATAYCHPSVSRYPCGHAVSDTGASSSARSMILPDPFPSHSILSSQTVTFDQRKFLLKHVPAININRKVVHEDMLQGPFELTIIVVKGADGFGFTITSSSFGQKIKQVIDSERCKNLTEGDILTKINGCVIKDLTHSEVVEVLKKCPRDEEAVLGVYRRGNLSRRRRQSNRSQSQKQKSDFTSVGNSSSVENGIRMTVKLDRGEFGFGIRIIGGIEEGSQVSIGYIVPGGVADIDGRLKVGNEIVAVNKQNVIGASHHQVVAIMNQSAQLGFVILDVLKHENRHQIELQNLPMNVSEVILTRKKDEGFGFVIISSITKAGSVVGKIIDGSPAGCCESLHVGDYILAINRVNISTMPHQEIVNLIKASGLSIVLTVSPVNGDKNNAIKPNLFHSEVREVGFITDCIIWLPRGFSEKRDTAADSFHLIELRRGSRGFGFSIRGGKEFDGMPLYILKIADEGPAKLDGRLQVGDQVIVINGCNTLNMMHSEAINLMQSSSISLSLLVKRSDCVSQEQVHDAYNWNSNSVPTETYEKIPWKKVERK